MSKRFLIIHGFGPLTMAASSTLSAASRYCSIRKEETCSASAPLSKPFADVSGGQQVLQVDVHAEQVADGVLVLGPVEAAQSDPALVRRCLSGLPADPRGKRLDFLGGGRGFSLGGMAPDLTRSSTVSHFSRFALSPKSGERLSRRNLPLGLFPSWQAWQCCAKNALAGSIAVLASGSDDRADAHVQSKEPMTTQSRLGGSHR